MDFALGIQNSIIFIP